MATQNSALYVGDLPKDVDNDRLEQIFSEIGALSSVRVCRDTASGVSLGYGYVNFISEEDASQAIEKLNNINVNGKPIRVMWSRRDSDARKSGAGNLYVKNLSENTDNTKLYNIFSEFGGVLSVKVATNQDGKSRGYGFVQFDSQESANSAIEKLSGTIVDGKQIYVDNFIGKNERVVPSPDEKYTNLYLKNLDQDITEEHLSAKFSEFGNISNVMIAKDFGGNSKGFGFVNFVSPDSAQRAVEAMNGVQLGSKNLYVSRAQKKVERQEILRRAHDEKHKDKITRNMATNLYVKNIKDSVDDNALREHFSQCGNITSAKVMFDDNGINRGFGFVCYSTPEEAIKAVNTLHGQKFHGKPLYITIAQKKEDRQAQLQLLFSQHMGGMSGSQTSVIPAGYPPFYYGPRGAMLQMPPQQGLMYQQQGWRPNEFVPLSRPTFQPMPYQMMPNTQSWQNRGQMNGYMTPQSGQSTPDLPNLQNLSLEDNSHLPQAKYRPKGHQYENNGLAPRDLNSQTLSSKLASSSPKQQKVLIGDCLYPLVEKLQCSLASKITGMLLEMDNNELLLLLESPEALAAKVEEAVQVIELSKNTHPVK